MVQHARRDGLLRFARNDDEEAGQRPARGSPGETLCRVPPAPLARWLKIGRPSHISNDNAEFYERKIVTSKGKSYLMRFMDASYKLFK
jgi:hypothetical protein